MANAPRSFSLRALLPKLLAGLSLIACQAAQPPGAVPRLLGPEEVLRPADPATPASCAARRERVAAELWNGVLALESGPEGDGRYQANDDFHWLTGVNVPDAALILVAREGLLERASLYLPPEDPRYELWNGPRLAPGEEAARSTGLADTRSSESFAIDLEALAGEGFQVLAAGERAEPFASPAGPDEEQETPNRLLRTLQAVKEPAEIAAMRAAIDITQAALADAMRVARPGAHEFSAEAALESGFRRRGAESPAFPSICGSGINSCILHYRANERALEDGDLLLMDVGAKLHHYCADVTRTIPVGGRFSARQREIYTLVWEASRRAAAVLRPGATLQQAEDVARAWLLEHGFDRKAFPHSIGHGLGLLVHDAPSRATPLEAGMVVTIEPGIYLPEEELGVRIEDDYLITPDGAELLSDDLPSQPDLLEAFLAELRGS